jgi:hypothetical protein
MRGAVRWALQSREPGAALYWPDIQYIAMPEEKLVTDLARNARLMAICGSCRRTQLLDLTVLLRSYGLRLKLDMLRRRLRCTRCGGRGALRIVYRSSAR